MISSTGSDMAASEFATIVKVCPIIFEEKLWSHLVGYRISRYSLHLHHQHLKNHLHVHSRLRWGTNHFYSLFRSPLLHFLLIASLWQFQEVTFISHNDNDYWRRSVVSHKSQPAAKVLKCLAPAGLEDKDCAVGVPQICWDQAFVLFLTCRIP